MNRHPASAVSGTTTTTDAAGMSLAQGAALTIGAVLGTGVISLPALAAGIAGPASFLAWVALVVLSVPLAATFGALGARYPDRGGVSTYVRAAFGARAATAVGWCFYFAIPMGAPPAALFAAGYVTDALGGGRTTTMVTAALLILGVATMNAYGLRVSGRVQLALAAALAGLLLVTVVAAVPHARMANLTPVAPHGWLAVGQAAAVLVWGFAGWETVSSLSADYRRPRRDIPRATAIAVAVVGVLYLGVVASSLLVLGPAAGTSAAPLGDLLAIGLGEPARRVTAVVAVLLTVGAINAYFAGGARLGAALGRDGGLPAWFGRGSSAGEVPRRSLAVVTALSVSWLVISAAAGVGLEASVLLVTGSFTLVYVLGTAAAVRLLPRGSASHAAAVVALVAVTGLLLLTGVHVLWGLGVAIVALSYDRLASRRSSAANMPRPSSSRSERVAP